MDKNEGFVTDIKDKDELNKIDKIRNMLNPNEKVLSFYWFLKSSHT